MSAGSKRSMLKSRSSNLPRFDWHGGALIRCIDWLNEAALRRDLFDALWHLAKFSGGFTVLSLLGSRCMKSTNPSSQNVPHPPNPVYRTSGRDYANPLDYQHPYESMAQLAQWLALRYDANRTRHSYYRQMRLIHEHGGCDPATMTEAQVRD
jgi:hypothetical protein